MTAKAEIDDIYMDLKAAGVPATKADIEKAIAAGFYECYDFTKQWEGGYVDHPSDPGGCTNRGITIHTLQAWRGDKSVNCADVKALTEDEAMLIYAVNYWRPVWGTDLPRGLNMCVWDFGVNAGPSRAIKKLQQMVGGCACDGVMGPNTLAAVQAYVDRRGVADAITEYTAMRQAYYQSLKTWDTFGKGWTRRNTACQKAALDLI